MRIGLDLHNVIDRFPVQFAMLTRRWINVYQHEVHVVTGQSWSEAKSQVDRLGVMYTAHFSIVDYHREANTPMVLKDTGWWMGQTEWDKSKGDYAARVGLDIHFEDSIGYAPWFPSSCTFVHVGFGSALPVLGDFLNAWDLLR